MQNRDAIDPQQLLAAFQHHIRAGTNDADVFCEMGPLLRAAGKVQEAKRCYKRTVELMLAAARRGDVDLALRIEQGAYVNFVRPVETEEHYYRCFADWREDMARLGRRLRDGRGWPEADARKVAFVLMTGHRLGHTEVLLRYVAAYAAGGDRRLEPVIYVLEACSNDFEALCDKAGVKLVSLVREQPGIADAGLGRKLMLLRERLRADRVGCAVWVSLPAGVPFALSMGLAPVQIYWALRFHPVAGPYIDGHLTYGAPGEKERYFGKQAWRVVPTPLAIEAPNADPSRVKAVRAGYPERFLFGTIARQDKIRSAPFLAAVAAILKAVPDAGYVWTGSEQDAEIQSYFVAQGVAERCHYAGWVDAPLYASALDAFLETFPLGCGVTGYQALGAGTPLLSYLDENTVFGMQYWNEVKATAQSSPDLSGYPILTARSADEYTQLAVKLASDAGFRAAAGQRGKAYFAQEVTLGVSHANEFFRAIEEVISAKLARAA
jgi:hypothetical protein